MKILYLIPGRLSQRLGSSELERRRNYLQASAEGDTEVSVWDCPDGPDSIESAAEGYQAVPPLLEGVGRAEKAGFDAIIIGCFSDPGLDAAREVAGIPIVGPCEASFLASFPLGDRLSIVTVLPSVVPTLRRAVRSLGFEGRLASIRSLDVPVLELGNRATQVFSAFLQEGKKALAEDGAEALVPGCMSMAFLGLAERAAESLGAPVVNPARVALKLAELCIACGLRPGKGKLAPEPRAAPR